VRMLVRMRLFVPMIVGVRVLVLMILHGMIVVVLVNFIRDDVNLGSAKAAAHHLAAIETRTDVQSCCSVLKQREGHARIHQGPKEHVTGDAREAFEIRNSHQ
jgi:hypothetical protein